MGRGVCRCGLRFSPKMILLNGLGEYRSGGKRVQFSLGVKSFDISCLFFRQAFFWESRREKGWRSCGILKDLRERG